MKKLTAYFLLITAFSSSAFAQIDIDGFYTAAAPLGKFKYEGKIWGVANSFANGHTVILKLATIGKGDFNSDLDINFTNDDLAFAENLVGAVGKHVSIKFDENHHVAEISVVDN